MTEEENDNGQTGSSKFVTEKDNLQLEKLRLEITQLKQETEHFFKKIKRFGSVLAIIVSVAGVALGVGELRNSFQNTHQERLNKERDKLAEYFDLLDSRNLDESKKGALGVIFLMNDKAHFDLVYKLLQYRALNLSKPDITQWVGSKEDYIIYEQESLDPMITIIEQLEDHQKTVLYDDLLLNDKIVMGKFRVLEKYSPTQKIWEKLASDPEIAFRKKLIQFLKVRSNFESLQHHADLKIDTINKILQK